MRIALFLAISAAFCAPAAVAQSTDPDLDKLHARVDAMVQDQSNDPSAWARMMSPDPQYRAEQQSAARQAQAYTNAEMNRNFLKAADMGRYTSQVDRDTIVRTLERTYAHKLGAQAFTIEKAMYFPQNANYAICGYATYWLGTTSFHGIFIFNSRVNGDKLVNATEEQARVNGCYSPANFPLTE